jgi:hypothetical protein
MVKTTLVLTLPMGNVAGRNVHVDLAGRFEQASVTMLVTPGAGVNVMVSVADAPAVALTVGVVEARVNPGAGLRTVTLALTCAVAPNGSTTVSMTRVVPTGYGPRGVLLLTLRLVLASFAIPSRTPRSKFRTVVP